jgi:dTMP kinase
VSGRLISFEGGEGAGKSTVLEAAEASLQAMGVDVLRLREPGGTVLGESIRGLLLDPAHRGMCAEAELLMMFASRAQLVREEIEPELARGRWILCDRFSDASFAYQGGGRGLPMARIAELERWAVGRQPDLSFLLDLPVAEGLSRTRGRGAPDRIEIEPEAFFERVRAVYRERAHADPTRWRIVDASQPAFDVAAAVAAHLQLWKQQHG